MVIGKRFEKTGNQYTGNAKHFLDWKNANTFSAGNMDLVQIPIYSSSAVMFMTDALAKNPSDRLKVLEMALHRLIIARKGKEVPMVRIATMIPSINYLRTHGGVFKAPKDFMPPNDFDGMLVVRNWQETPQAIWQYRNGRRREMKIQHASTNLFNADDHITPFSTSPCEPVQVIVGYQKFCICAPINDEPCCVNPEDWEEDYDHPIYEYVPADPGACLDENGGYDEPGCAGLTEEECICLTYGLGCGENGNPEHPQEQNPCYVPPAASQAISTLFSSLPFQQGLAAIVGQNPNYEHTVTFGKDANGNITASPLKVGINGTNGTVDAQWPNAFADLHNHPNEQPPSPADLYNLIGLNGNNNNHRYRIVKMPNGELLGFALLNSQQALQFRSLHPPRPTNYGPDFPMDMYDSWNAVYDNVLLSGKPALEAEIAALSFLLDYYATGITLVRIDSQGHPKTIKTEKVSVNGNETYIISSCQ